MGIKISLLTNDGTSDPVQLTDLFIMSNDDGVGGFDVSKKITIQEAIDFIVAFGFAFAEDVVITGTGTGIGESTMKAADLDEDGSVYVGSASTLTGTNYAWWHAPTGSSFFNALAGQDLIISLSNNEMIACRDDGIQIGSRDELRIRVGANISDDPSVKFIVGSETDDNMAYVADFKFDGTSNLKIDNDGLILLTNGTLGDTGGDVFGIGHKDHFGSVAFRQDSDGAVRVNSANTSENVEITVSGGQRVSCTDEGVEIASSAAKRVSIGTSIVPGQAKLLIKGLANTGTLPNVLILDSADVANFKIRNDSLVFLRNGTGINNISTDGTAAGDSDDSIMTEKAIKTLVASSATPLIIGGLVVTSTSTTNVSNGSYNILEDTTALTSVSSGIAQDSDWTLEITEAGIANQKGRVSAVIKCEKTGGAGRQYDFAIFKNGSIISDSEMTDLTLENNDTWSNIKCTAPVELSTGDLFSIRVSGNGTGDDIECTNGTIYID